MKFKASGFITVAIALTASAATAAQPPTGKTGAEQNVLDFASDFNQHDVDAMQVLASDDVTLTSEPMQPTTWPAA